MRVHQKIEDAGKKKGEVRSRIQIFEGTVISISGKNENKMFTVRRIGAGGIGIERIFPILSPIIDKVEVASYGDIRRAKLYYLREKTAREVSEITKRYLRKAQAAKQAAMKQSKSKPTAKRQGSAKQVLMVTVKAKPKKQAAKRKRK